MISETISLRSISRSPCFQVTYCLNLFLGLAIFLVLLLCSTSISESVHLIGLIIPQYSFIQGILVLFKNHITADIYELFDQDVYEDPLTLLRANYVVMFIVGTCCFILNIIMDYNMLPLLNSGKESEIPQNEDADVVMERKRVVSAIGDDVLSLVNLTKDYKTFGESRSILSKQNCKPFCWAVRKFLDRQYSRGCLPEFFQGSPNLIERLIACLSESARESVSDSWA